MYARATRMFLVLGATLALSVSLARAQDGGQPGECASGFCGTPKNNGGGGGGGGGGSVLVNNTDIGKTYSKTDDYDGDGIADDSDNCPYVANRDQADQDGDQIGDVCDNCPTTANVDQHDINANGIGDACDPDIDGDGLKNAVDNCPYVPNKDQGDINQNGVGDLCDPDMDGDGVANAVDNCPRIYNPDQSKTIPGLHGNACDFDADKDSIDDSKDNCPAVYNPDQVDTNKNGVGDACDPDMDGDGVPNQIDNCPLVVNPDQTDKDQDGVGDACETHGFCFMPRIVGSPANSAAPCLDPTSVFEVTAAPHVMATTGGDILLRLFSNRQNVGIKYSFVVTQRPDGASDSIAFPIGTVSISDKYEYHFTSDDQWPKFVATAPGTYKINLAADLVKPDPLFPSVLHAESEVEFEAQGPVVSAGGCSIPRGRGAGEGVLLFGLLVVAGALVRRKSR